jgi:diguanylate cyclase (GGDEF)-like protein
MFTQSTLKDNWFKYAGLGATLLPASAVLAGWVYVFSDSRHLSHTAIQAYQNRQLQELYGWSNVASGLVSRELTDSVAVQPKTIVPPINAKSLTAKNLTQLRQVEHVLLTQLLEPLQAHSNAQFWLIPQGASALPVVPQIQATQPLPFSPSPLLLRTLRGGNDSTLIHESTVVPQQQSLAFLLPDLNRTASTWISFPILSGTSQAQTWMLGVSKPLASVLQEAGVLAQIEAAFCRMSWLTIGLMGLWGVLWKLHRNQQEYKVELERVSRTDALTGLANRRQLNQSGELALRQLQPQAPLALISLDLDRFKPINDTLGPEAGDELLVKVAQRLRACVRQEDLLARLDGDEFAVLLQNSSEQHARICAERLLKALHQPFWVNHTAVYINCSLGIATTSIPTQPFSQLLVQADIAMDRSKDQRQGGYTMFDLSMHAEKIARLELERDLRNAIAAQELQVFYQPIVDLKTSHIMGYEALIRWQHRFKGLLQPGDFLPIAAEIGLSPTIERWVLRQACQQMMDWHYITHTHQPYGATIPPSVSVNLSAQHFAQTDLVQYVESVLQETGWPAHRLTLEITEEAMIHHPEQVAEVLLQLQHLGVRISLDDFGTGYSSLSYLQRFPVDVLKIDKSFIQTVGDRVQDGEIVRTIIGLANSLGVGTIAEGIETQAQLHQLKALRCQYGQGFLFSQPLKSIPSDRLIYC